MASPSDLHHQARQSTLPRRSNTKNTLSMPPSWLQMYDDFITKNAHQVSQIESALRSLTYIIPGKPAHAEARTPESMRVEN